MWINNASAMLVNRAQVDGQVPHRAVLVHAIPVAILYLKNHKIMDILPTGQGVTKKDRFIAMNDFACDGAN